MNRREILRTVLMWLAVFGLWLFIMLVWLPWVAGL